MVVSSPKEQESPKERVSHLAFSQVYMTRPRSPVPVSASLSISWMRSSTRMPSVLVPADSGRAEALCLVRYVYLFFRMVLLFRVLSRLRCPYVREDEEDVIAGHCHEKDKNDLSVLHGYMALDNGVLSPGKGWKASPSLAALASSRAFRHVASVKYSMFRCTPVM